MSPSKTKYWPLIALILLPSNPAHADTSVYRWQDTKGMWHFSDKRPLSMVATTVISTVPKQSINLSTSPRFKSMDASTTQKKTQTKPREKRRDPARKAKQAQTCQTLKDKLAKIQKKLRAGYKEPSGNRLRAKRRKIKSKIYQQC